MAFNLRNRNFLKLLDFTPEEIKFLLKLAADLKAAKYAGTEQPKLTGKNIALIFEKTSTRTRCAFEVGAKDQGAHVTYLGPTGSQIGIKESMKDTARVLGRMFDGIEYRGFDQATVEELAKYAGVPVWNGLTAEAHPTQILADFLTIQEHTDKPLNQVTFAYIGIISYTACILVNGGSGIGFLTSMAIIMAAGMITTAVLSLLSYYVAVASTKFGLDPDDESIPITSSVMDLVGSVILVSVISVFI